MKRIMIVGAAGSGKSTAARAIGERLGLPVFHMDRDVYWLPNWEERPEPDRQARVADLVNQDAWVFEGSYSRTFSLRLTRAEMLIWLDPPLLLRLFRVIRRTFQQRGESRSDMAEGCVERVDMLPGFLWFIVSTAKSSRRKQRALFDSATIPKHRLRFAADTNRFIETLNP